MNLYGIATGTDTYSLRVQERPGSQLCVGDTITLNLLNANTGASTLSINGRDSIPMFVNGADAASGALRAGKDLQFTFTGSSLNLDVGDSILSADDIQLASPVDTSGTSTAYTLTDSRVALTDGRLFSFRAHATSGTSPTLAVNGNTARALYRYRADGNLSAFSAGMLKSGSVVICQYFSSGPGFLVRSHFVLDTVDIPAVLDLENLGLHGGYGNIAATIAQMLFDHSYNHGSYEFRCNSSRVGGFPLEPSDMPQLYRLEADGLDPQNTSSGTTVTKTYNTPAVNTGPAWSYSGGVWTCLIGGRFDVHAAAGYKSGDSTLTSVRLLVDGTIVAEGTTVAASANPVVDATLNIAAGSTLQICPFSAGTYAIDTTARGKRELYIQMVSK